MLNLKVDLLGAVDRVLPCLHFLRGEWLNHLLAEVIHSLHLRGLQRELADFSSGTGGRPIDLDLYHFSFDNLSLLPTMYLTVNKPVHHMQAMCMSRLL